ncbi:uncharacterized protein [Apostichopus japonicus]|uniref:uncharacterized protein isoform X2 n=1 Tax=Stichopus japonicus TaxID=307972 RepID=UPI003AB6B1B5
MCGEYSPRSCGVSGRSKCKRAKTILICRSLICRRSVRDDDDTSCGNDMTLNSRATLDTVCGEKVLGSHRFQLSQKPSQTKMEMGMMRSR